VGKIQDNAQLANGQSKLLDNRRQRAHLLGGSVALLGFGADFGSAVSIVEAGGDSGWALSLGDYANASAAGAGLLGGEYFIPADWGGFQP
jgi:hypothetical protein